MIAELGKYPRPRWQCVAKLEEKASLRLINDSHEDTCAPRIGIVAIAPCNGSAQQGFQRGLGAKPTMLCLRSGENDGELEHSEKGVAPH